MPPTVGVKVAITCLCFHFTKGTEISLTFGQIIYLSVCLTCYQWKNEYVV